MHSVNRFFILFVVLAVFASARSFGDEFTPMTTLFDSSAVPQTSDSDSQGAASSVPARPEDIQFPEPTRDVDLTIIPPPQPVETDSSNLPKTNATPQSTAVSPQEAASIEQVGFYLPQQPATQSIPRSTLPDLDAFDSDDFRVDQKPENYYASSAGAAPSPDAVPEDVRAMVDSAEALPDGAAVRRVSGNFSGQNTPVTNPSGTTTFMNQPVVPMEPVVEGSNPQMFREDYDYQQFRSEMLGEIEKHAWTTGDFQVIPYAKLWASVSYETKPTQIGSAPFFVTQPSNTGKQAHVDYRGTILGFNMKAKNLSLWEGSKVMGKVEFDLQRTIDFDNKTTVHLRHCYVEAVSDEWRILAGQTWDVVSPLAPGTLMYSAGWMDGNVGYRRAQFRLERYINVSECFQWKLQGCISAPFAGDSNALLGPEYRLKYGSWPIVQGRIAAVLGYRRCPQKPMEIGIAAHIGELQYGQKVEGAEDTNHFAKTWGIYLDAYVPITCWFGVQGELFKGENMAMFLGGINQGVMRSAAGTPESIAAQGGWINMWFNLNEFTQLRVGYMIDDPQGRIDEITDTTLSARTLNHSLFANIKCDITKLWWVGVEYSHVETGWTGKETGVSACDRVDVVSYFSF